MYVYVIASSSDGPCKVGSATNPKSRLKDIQTGSPDPLSLHHVEQVGTIAKYVELATHRALKQKKSDGGREWFNMPPREAQIMLRATASAASILTDGSSTLREIQHKSSMQWLRECDDYAEECKEYGLFNHEELEQFSPASALEILAEAVSPPLTSKFNFNNYLLTWDDGMWLRWAFERMGKPMPTGKRLLPYLEADQFLEKQGAKLGREVASKWVEWSLARDLTESECNNLASIWDRFVPLHNQIERHGPQNPSYGIDDHVDDVHLSAITGDEDRGDRSYVQFWHPSFRAILVPKKKVQLHKIDWSMFSEAIPLGDTPVLGFIAPTIPRDIWERPVLPWLKEAAQQRDKAFHSFLKNPCKRFPQPCVCTEPPPLTRIHYNLPCIDEYGTY